MVNREKTNELLFAKEKIACTKSEYHNEVRDAILDFQIRMADLGKADESKFCLKEIQRLDKEHGVPQHHVDQGREPLSI